MNGGDGEDFYTVSSNNTMLIQCECAHNWKKKQCDFLLSNKEPQQGNQNNAIVGTSTMSLTNDDTLSDTYYLSLVAKLCLKEQALQAFLPCLCGSVLPRSLVFRPDPSNVSVFMLQRSREILAQSGPT